MEVEKLRIQVAELKNSLAQAKQQKTLRDEFAMAALSMDLDSRGYGLEGFVKSAYDVADMMLWQRER
jgi:hypothetical protein